MTTNRRLMGDGAPSTATVMAQQHFLAVGGHHNITNCAHTPVSCVKIASHLWMMDRPTLFTCDSSQGRVGLVIEHGYPSDGPSIPRWGQAGVMFDQAFDWAWPHDQGYEAHGGDRLVRYWQPDSSVRTVALFDAFSGAPLALPKSFLDEWLFRGWISDGMDELPALAGYAAVSLFGGSAWDSEEKDFPIVPYPKLPYEAPR